MARRTATPPIARATLQGEGERLASAAFWTLNISAFFSAVSFSMLLPMISLLVVAQTGGGDVAVGFAISIFAVSAIAARPAIGLLGDKRGRRFLVMVGCLLTGLTTLGHIWADTYFVILAMRLLIGAFQGAFFVGSAALVSDLVPEGRRGEAFSWFSVAIYGGMAIGPAMGEAAKRWGDASSGIDGFDLAFAVSGVLMLAAAAVGAMLPKERSLLRAPQAPSPPPRVFSTQDAGQAEEEASPAATPPNSAAGRFFYGPAVWPGLILAMGIVIFPALQGYLPKLAAEKDLGDFGPVFALYGLLVLALRVVGRKLPDRLGVRKTATVALSGAALGMTIMGTFPTPVGLYTGVVVLALGGSLLYPALMVAAVEGVPPYERARAVSTFTMFFELSAGIGGPILGVTAALAGATVGAFYAAGVCALGGIVLLHVWQRSGRAH